MPIADLKPEWSDKVERDRDFLVQCFAEVLEELGESSLVAFLPWRTTGVPRRAKTSTDIAETNHRLQVISIAFHLLNLVRKTPLPWDAASGSGTWDCSTNRACGGRD